MAALGGFRWQWRWGIALAVVVDSVGRIALPAALGDSVGGGGDIGRVENHDGYSRLVSGYTCFSFTYYYYSLIFT